MGGRWDGVGGRWVAGGCGREVLVEGDGCEGAAGMGEREDDGAGEGAGGWHRWGVGLGERRGGFSGLGMR